MADHAARKDELRQAALARRDALSPQWRAEASIEAARNGAGAIALEAGAVVAGFLPIRSEIDPTPLMQRLAQGGARLCLPCIVDAETIVFRAWRPGDPLQDMKLATRGATGSAMAAASTIARSRVWRLVVQLHA